MSNGHDVCGKVESSQVKNERKEHAPKSEMDQQKINKYQLVSSGDDCALQFYFICIVLLRGTEGASKEIDVVAALK